MLKWVISVIVLLGLATAYRFLVWIGITGALLEGIWLGFTIIVIAGYTYWLFH